MPRRLAAALAVALAALFALPGIAAAEGGLPTIGLEIRSVNTATRQLTAVLHCVPAEKAGREVRFVVGSSVADDALAALQPGQLTGARVVVNTPPVVVALAPMPCDPQAGPKPQRSPSRETSPSRRPAIRSRATTPTRRRTIRPRARSSSAGSSLASGRSSPRWTAMRPVS